MTSTSGNNYKFTGKERDSETGLDYFGARHYANNLGRFLQADRGDLALRHIINPQKWNRFSYTINNPLAFVDPNGEEEVKVTFRAFIPQKSVAGFGGDNRNYSANPNASSRTSISFTVETDPARRGSANPLIGKAEVEIGITKLDLGVTMIHKTATGPSLPFAVAAFDASGNTVIQINQNVENPLAPGLGIRSDLTVTLPTNASSISIQGTISGSPSFEMNVSVNKGPSQNIQLQRAAQGDREFVRNLQNTVRVKVEQPLKKRREEE